MSLQNVGGRDFHVKLTDRSGNSVGLNIVNTGGDDDALQFEQSNHPRTPLQTSQGQGEYSDLLLPYKELVQSDWQGGRGMLAFRKDKTRYMDAGNVDTELEGQVILRGLPRYGTGWRAVTHDNVPGDVYWENFTSNGAYKATKFTATDDIAAGDIEVMVWVKRQTESSGGIFYVSICPDDTGDPDYGSLLGEATLTSSDMQEGHGEEVVFRNFCSTGITNGNDYHVLVWSSGYWEIGTNDNDETGERSDTGNVGDWTDDDRALYYRVYDNSNPDNCQFFEYKGALYMVERPKDLLQDSRIFINGDRGVADSNTGNLDRVVDATKSWTANEFYDAIVMITAGPGRTEDQPWRYIISNDPTYLRVSPPWNIEHTTDTEYVILNANSWRVHATISSKSVRDMEAIGDYVFFTTRSNAIVRYHERNVAGTWTISSVSTENFTYADFIKGVHDPDEGTVLWGGYNGNDVYGAAIWRASVPPVHSIYGLFEKAGVLDEVDKPWDEQDTGASGAIELIENGALKITIAGSYGTGILASKKFSTPVDITQGEGIGFIIKSSVACSASDLSLLLDDTPYCGKKYIPDYLYLYDAEGYPKFYLFDASESDAADKWKQQGNTELRRTQDEYYFFNITMALQDYVYIGYHQQFTELEFDLTAVNGNAAVMTINYWDGQAWTSTGATDNTASGGDTLAQDGSMTWTRPAVWNPGTHGDQADYLDQSLYWVQLDSSAALDNVTGTVHVKEAILYNYHSLPLAKDGDDATYENLSLSTSDYIYVGSDFKFDRVYFDMGTTVNAVTAALSCEYFNGATWEGLSITADYTDPTGDQSGATLSQDGVVVVAIQHFDWAKLSIEQAEAYWLRFSVDADLTPAIDVIEIAVQSDNATALDLPALVANEPTWVNPTPGTFRANPEPDHSNIVSMGLRLNTDLGAQTIRIYGPVYITRYPVLIPLAGTNDRITGLGAHGDERTNLIVHTESNIYEVRGQDNNAIVPLPLDELSTLRSVINGRANCHNDVYHYFNLNDLIERYVDGSLENVGPDEDDGLPEDRIGLPVDLLSHPEKVMLSISPKFSGPRTSGIYTGRATIHARRNSGWHEVHRGPIIKDDSDTYKYSAIINNFYYVSTYQGPHRIWICQDGDLIWVPSVVDNPLNHIERSEGVIESYYYKAQGYLITGWFDAGFIDVEKTFTHLKIASENLNASHFIRAFYQEDSGDLISTTPGIWTEISDVFDTSPSQRIELSTTADVSCRRIRFKFILETAERYTTPVIKAINLQVIFYHPVKEVYSFPYRSNDVGVSVDRQPDHTQAAVTFDALIKTWGSPPANVLTLNCVHPSFDDKSVVLQYPSGKPLESDPQGGPEAESLIRELVLMEI